MALDEKTSKGNCKEAHHASLLESDVRGMSRMEYSYEDPETNSNDDTDDPSNRAPSETNNQCSTLVKCLQCHRNYKNKKSLAVHMQNKHKDSIVSHAKMPCLERNCDFRGNRIANLITHLIQVHKKKFHCEKVTFQHQEEFWTWKKEAEDRCRATYSAVTASRELAFGDQKLFLRCNRSGFSKSSDSKCVRTLKRKRTSMKINAVCTSFIAVTFFKEGGAGVNFCKTHYGHRGDDSYIRMNDEEKGMIKELIIKGLNASEIIACMKTRLPVHRHQLLKYGNIRNVSLRQNLLLRRNKGFHFLNDWLLENNRYDHNIKSCDMDINLNVENEVEIEAGCNSEPRVEEMPFPVSSQENSSNIYESPQMCTKEELINEVVAKAQKISKLAVGLVSKTSLTVLSQKLDSILNYTNEEEHIQVIPEEMETSGNCHQIKREEHIEIHHEELETIGPCHQIKQELIQIIPEEMETSGSCYQIKHMFDGEKGNSISLVCSDKDVNELSYEKNEV